MSDPSDHKRLFSLSHRLDLGLRWLDRDAPTDPPRVDDWRGFLRQADRLPPHRRLWLARLWPLAAALSGVLAFSGLMIWPNGSGVHLLLFLTTFWLVPFLLLVWTVIASLGLKRTPWWRPLLTPHRDAVIAAWCGRQALLAQGAFVVAGLAWMWLMLATRQVIFYWSTSIDAVSSRVDDGLAALTLGLIDVPEPLAVGAAQAGAITGWTQALLHYSYYWASWLTQVVALWVLVPLAAALVLSQWVLSRRLRRWPDWNRAMRLRFDACRAPGLAFRALQPEQPPTEAATHRFDATARMPDVPGFGWHLAEDRLPAGSTALGAREVRTDRERIRAEAGRLSHWYIAGHSVPTGDLADLIQLHRDAGGDPRLWVVADSEADRRTEALTHSWSVFLDRNRLSVPLTLVTGARHERSR